MTSRRNSVIGTVLDLVKTSPELHPGHGKRRHTIVDGLVDGSILTEDSLTGIKQNVTSYINEASSSAASLLSNAASTMRSVFSSVFEENEEDDPESDAGKMKRTISKKRTKFRPPTRASSSYLISLQSQSSHKSRQSISDKSECYQHNSERRHGFQRKYSNETNCRKWLTSLSEYCNNVAAMKKSNSVDLQTWRSSCQAFADMGLVRAYSFDKSSAHETSNNTLHSLTNIASASSNEDDDVMTLAGGVSMTDRRYTLGSDNDRKIFKGCYRLGEVRPQTNNFGISNLLDSNQSCAKTESKPTFVHTPDGWKAVRDGTVNIVPEEECFFKRTPHLKRKMKTDPENLSKSEIDYAYNKSDCIKEPNEEEVNNISFGNLNLAIQFLIISKRLKITIQSLENAVDTVSKNTDNTKKCKQKQSYIIKVCVVPRNGKKQKCVKSTKGRETIEFNQDIYLKNVTFENVHLLTLRFQLYRKLSRNILKRHVCVAETTVCLDDLDVIGRVELRKTLHKTSS